MDTSMKIRAGIAGIPELRIMGKSTFLISITSDVVNPYFVNDYLYSKGWRMNGCQDPLGFHFCITLPQTQPGIAESLRQGPGGWGHLCQGPALRCSQDRLPVWLWRFQPTGAKCCTRG